MGRSKGHSRSRGMSTHYRDTFDRALELKPTPTSIPAEALEWGPSSVQPPEGDPDLTHDPPTLPGEMAPTGDEELGLDPPVLSGELAQENFLRPALKPPIQSALA